MVKAARRKRKTTPATVREQKEREDTGQKLALRKNLSPRQTDTRAIKSADDAYEAATAFLRSESLVGEEDTSDLHGQLVVISRAYWSDALVDELIREGGIKNRLNETSKAIQRLSAKIYENDYLIEHYQSKNLYAPMIFDLDGFDLDILKAELGALHSFCEAFAKQNFSKAGTCPNRTRNCCAALWKLREELTGRSFKRSYDPSASKVRNKMTGTPDVEFKADDARFVQMVLRAIDPKVPFQTIRKSLRDVGETSKKSSSGPLGVAPFFKEQNA